MNFVNLRKALIALAMVSLPAALAQQMTCAANSGVPPIVRAEGMVETVGDLVVSCTGGTPTTAGAPVPQASVQIFLNTNITSRLTTETWSEALLLIDEPASGVQRYCSQNGGCPITGVGATAGNDGIADGVDYDAPNGTGAAPNIYQGRQLASNSITWQSIPIDPPGNGALRILRLTNIRANANALGVANTLIPTQILMLVSITGASPIPLTNPQQMVAFIQPGLNFSVRQTTGGHPQCISFNGAAAGGGSSPLADGLATIVRFSELFSSSFRSRSAGPYVDGDSSPVPANSNEPGAIYYRETAFYNSTPNVVAGATHGLNTAGLADHGTRLMARFANVPAGVVLYATAYPVLTCEDCGPSGRPAITAVRNAASVSQTMARLITTNASGGGPFTPVPATSNSSLNAGAATARIPLENGAGIAVWEVVSADPLGAQTYEFGIGVSYTANTAALGTATVAGSLAPLGATSTTSFPRFADTGSARPALTIAPCTVILTPSIAAAPAAGATGNTITVTTYSPGTAWTAAPNVPWLTITAGASGSGGGTVTYNVAANNSINNRTGTLTIGAWLFTVNQSAMTATYTLSKATEDIGAGAGTGTVLLTVTPSDAPWSVLGFPYSYGWVTVSPGSGAGSATLTYSYTANPETSQRIGSLTIANQTLILTQAAIQPVNVTLSPASDDAPMGGENGRKVNVNVAAGTAWTAVSAVPWIFITSGASGTGNGTVTYNVAPTLGARNGKITIGGQPFPVTQNGPSTYSTGPITGSGLNNLFVLKFTHPVSVDKFEVVNMLINEYLNGDRACYIAYSRPLNVLYLVTGLSKLGQED